MNDRGEHNDGFFERKASDIARRVERTSGRKLIIALLVVISVSVLSLGYLQFKYQLDEPFFDDKLVEDQARIRGPIEILNYFKEQQRNNDQLVRLQQMDSDKDGLSDYQEQYIYKTNPYTADSDQDQINDNDEVAQGTDPNCPEGQICDTEGFVISQEVQSTQNVQQPGSEIAQEAAQSEQLLEQLSDEEKANLEEYFSQLTTEDIKQLLIEQGYPSEQLDQLDDEVLRDVLQGLFANL